MLKKLNSLFRPHSERELSESGGEERWKRKESGVRLVRSTSLYLIGENDHKSSSSLKRSKSSVSIETAVYNFKEEDRAWMLSRTQDCLQYLQELIVLRQQYRYINNLNHLKPSANKSQPPPVPAKSSKPGKKQVSPKDSSKKTKEKSSSVPLSKEAETLEYLDSVIADFDQDNKCKVPITEYMNVDVDFDVAVSTSEHSLHSNWQLKSPRRYSMDVAHSEKIEKSRRNSDGVRMSFKRLERHPIYLPKVVESPFHTLRFKPIRKDDLV
ncbi:uncharacterized protein C13orf42 [Callorhinchus milii]|uniref:uncharacterized protein C13orf42 n=1 Tax=Callorhinchus milii TaxID=7868 RepID=UPI001C3FC558|nr:uncharacterized protein C13orf42 [Callorhinchus milii]